MKTNTIETTEAPTETNTAMARTLNALLDTCRERGFGIMIAQDGELLPSLPLLIYSPEGFLTMLTGQDTTIPEPTAPITEDMTFRELLDYAVTNDFEVVIRPEMDSKKRRRLVIPAEGARQMLPPFAMAPE